MEGIVELHQPRASAWPSFITPQRRLIAFIALLIALVAAFAWVVMHFQNESRHQAQSRFREEAALTSQFTGALLATSASGAATAAAQKAFGGATIKPAVLKPKPGTGIAYYVVLDAHGARIAASPGVPATAAARTATHVRQAIAGKAWFSDLIASRKYGGHVLEWAFPFAAASGGHRIVVEAVQAKAITALLDSILTRTQPTGNGQDGAAVILDAKHHVVGTSTTKLKTGELPTSAPLLAALGTKSAGSYRGSAGRRYFASAPIAGSTWTALLTTPTARLYPALAGSQAWLLDVVLGAFALACAASAVFFHRAIATSSALQAVNATLEDRVAERTAAAEDRARELARSNQELEQFSAVASHDLQEPLRKVRMFGDRLRDRLGDTVSEDAIADLERMQSAAERMQHLISDLLEFSRITHRGQPFEEVDLGDVAAEVVSDLEARIVELGATVQIDDLPVVHADRTQMRQLLQNLIANALKFHRPDVAPVVHVRAQMIPALAPRFAAETVASDRYVLVVEDNGIGFDEQYAERIFGAFERLHGRSAYEGTGIGLSIARKIVWRHGGHIGASAAPGEGATFTITLPVTPPTTPRGGEE